MVESTGGAKVNVVDTQLDDAAVPYVEVSKTETVAGAVAGLRAGLRARGAPPNRMRALTGRPPASHRPGS